MCHTGPAPDTDFNPRPPRGGRRGLSATNIRYTAISIHAPREGGDFYMAALLTSLGISIHAPREGGDRKDEGEKVVNVNFNPRPPRGGRLQDVHAVRSLKNFNPRPPRGGRRFVRIVSLSLPIISIHAPREGGDDL